MINKYTEHISIATSKQYQVNEVNIYPIGLDASGLPSLTGAGGIDFSRVNDYYSETALTGNVVWGTTNILQGKCVSIDVKVSTFSVTLTQSGVTFKGAVNSSGVVQGTDSIKSNLIVLWAQTSTLIWVNVLKNQG